MADYQIATNQWIKDNISPGYSIPTGMGSKCPTKAEIQSNSKSGSGIKASNNLGFSYSDNQLVSTASIYIDSNTKKSFTFYFNNSFGLNLLRIYLRAYNSSTGEYKNLLIEENPIDDKGTSEYPLSSPLLGINWTLRFYIKSNDSSRDDTIKWFSDGTTQSWSKTFTGKDEYECESSFDSWLVNASSCKISLND